MASLAATALVFITVPVAGKPDTASPPGNANVFILRDKAEPLLVKVEVEIDGQFRIRLGNKSFTAVRVEPGLSFVRIHWPGEDRAGDLVAPLMVKEGEPLFFELTGSVQARGHSVARLKLSHLPGFEPLDAARAPARIAACCRYRAAEVIDPAERPD